MANDDEKYLDDLLNSFISGNSTADRNKEDSTENSTEDFAEDSVEDSYDSENIEDSSDEQQSFGDIKDWPDIDDSGAMQAMFDSFGQDYSDNDENTQDTASDDFLGDILKDDADDIGNFGDLSDIGNLDELGDFGNLGDIDSLDDIGNLGNLDDLGDIGDIGDFGNLGIPDDISISGDIDSIDDTPNLSEKPEMVDVPEQDALAQLSQALVRDEEEFGQDEPGDEESNESADEPPKKAGIFAKLFGKKDKKEAEDKDNNKDNKAKKKKSKSVKTSASNAEQANLANDNEALLNEIYGDKDSLDDVHITDSPEDLDDIEDIEERAEEKPKKEKKKKEKKPKKEKAPKPKKPKKQKAPKGPSEMIHFTKAHVIGILIFTVIIVVSTIFLGSVLTYSSSMSQSKRDYNHGKYHRAYDRIAGVEIKAADMDYYNRLRTVMAVYVDYDAYENYKKIGLNGEALNSLILGILAYYDNYEYAEKYDVLDDYNEVYQLILDTLADYGISEDEAMRYYEIENKTQYFEILESIGGNR